MVPLKPTAFGQPYNRRKISEVRVLLRPEQGSLENENCVINPFCEVRSFLIVVL